jgi:hypothetical protein
MGIDSVVWIVGAAAALTFAVMFYGRRGKRGRGKDALTADQQHNADVATQSTFAAQLDLQHGMRKARRDDWNDATDSSGGDGGGGGGD